MPDPWEYPWYAAWDLAFHCVTLAHIDPEFAKSQLILLLREWYMHPNGQIPAYEWNFSDVNPPVHAWAALRVFELDGGTDFDVPDPDLPQAADQLHLVDQQQGARRQQPVPGRLHGAGQHRADRPLARSRPRSATSSRPTRPPGWRCTRSTCSRSRCDWRARPGVRGRRHQVLRALPRDRARGQHLGPVGRGGRVLLRRAAPDRRSRRPDQGAVPRRPDPGDRGARVPRQRGSPQLPEFAERGAWYLENHPELPQRCSTRRTRTEPIGCSRSSHRSDWSGSWSDVRRGRRCCRRTGSARSRPTTGTTPSSSRRAASASPRPTTSRPSRPRPCSAATPTGAGRSGSR